jgi:CubicO group peptidase (beta-lactamase class C family)
MAPTLARIVGSDRLRLWPPLMACDDVAYFAEAAPTLFFWIGVTPAGIDSTHVAPNHSPSWKDWVRESTTSYSETTGFGEGFGYGYLWWVHGYGMNVDVFSARGALGKYIVVIPERDLVSHL